MNSLLYLAQSFETTQFETVPIETEPEITGAAAVFVLVFWLFYFVVIAAMLAGMWKIFTKAGKPGWASIVPIYNTVVLVEIVGRPMWWVAMLFVPFANVVFAVMLAIDLAKSFGKDVGYGLLLAFVPIVGYPMLGFGSAQYRGPVAVGAQGSMNSGMGMPPQPNMGVPNAPQAPAQPMMQQPPQAPAPQAQAPVTPEQQPPQQPPQQ